MHAGLYKMTSPLKGVIKKFLGLTGLNLLRKVFQFPGRSINYLVGEERIRRISGGIERQLANSPFAVKLKKEIKVNFKIGIAVLAHERPDILELCLNSLFQTKLYDYDVTFLLQDDGSTDHRVHELIEQKRDQKYKIVRYYSKKGHNSWGAAFNKAMRKLLEIDNFDIICSCDSDAFFHPEWLDQTLKVCLWAKKNHKDHILGPFSSFNSSDFIFHRILGKYTSPYGRYLVKERMGALNYFCFKEDLLKIGFFEESKDDETIMTENLKKMRVRNFCTDISYIEHIGRSASTLDQWRPVSVGSKAAFALNNESTGWKIPETFPNGFPFLKLSNNLVLNILYGGLGDHLFHSHLPRIAKETGRYKRVYISNSSIFRNEEIRRLIWEKNPYVDGFCNESGSCLQIENIRKGNNFLDEVMLFYNLDDGQRDHKPEIYYKPKLREELKDKIVYDPNYISNAGDLKLKTIKTFFRDSKIHIDFQMNLRERHLAVDEFDAWLESKSLEDFCDIIFSCKEVYCLVTGTATLANALNKGVNVLYGKGVVSWFLHSKLNRYIRLN